MSSLLAAESCPLSKPIRNQENAICTFESPKRGNRYMINVAYNVNVKHITYDFTCHNTDNSIDNDDTDSDIEQFSGISY